MAVIAVAVIGAGVTIGHLPRKISRVCSIFLRRGGSMHCVASRGQRYSADLPQGGMEIPCKLHFEGKIKEISKVKRYFKDKHTVKCIKVESVETTDTSK